MKTCFMVYMWAVTIYTKQWPNFMNLGQRKIVLKQEMHQINKNNRLGFILNLLSTYSEMFYDLQEALNAGCSVK